MGDVLSAVVGGAESLGSSAISGIEGLGSSALSGIGSLAGDIGGLFSGGSLSAGASPSASPSLGASPLPTVTAPASTMTPSSGASAASVASALPTDASGLTNPATALSGANLTDATSQFPTSMVSPVPGGVTAGGNVPLTNDTSSLGNVSLTNPTAGLATPTAGGGAGGGGFLQSLLSNPKELAGGAGIILDLLKSGQAPPGSGALKSLAGTDAALASSYGAQAQAEGQGLLPAGAQALIQNDLNSKIAGIQQRYASMGMSGSTAEQQDMAAARSAALAQTFQIGQAMASQGLQEVTNASGQEAQLLQQIMNAEISQNSALGQALAGFAGAGTDAGAKAA